MNPGIRLGHGQVCMKNFNYRKRHHSLIGLLDSQKYLNAESDSSSGAIHLATKKLQRFVPTMLIT